MTKATQNRAKAIDLLNRRLADSVDLQTQVKQAHWNVKGPSFIGLHELFDKVFDAVVEYGDLIAERVVQLDGVALGTARVAAARSALAEYPLKLSAGTDHAKQLAARLSAYAEKVRAAIDVSDGLNDAVTADICTEIARGTDKWRWMVESHVKAPK